MQRVCANGWCGQTFDVTDEDLAFYQKMPPMFGGKTCSIPPPTRCPDCRTVRRMRCRNERFLYRRTCDLSGKSILSSYPSGTPFPVYEREEWLSDRWDPMTYGRAIKVDQSFLAQFGELLQAVPRAALNGKNVENCDYCNFSFNSRDCYLTPCSYYSESLLYSYWMLYAKDCVDCSYLFRSQRCYESTDCNHSYECFHCTLCHSCSDCHQSYDCVGCSHCFGCVGLRHKSYCVFNEQLTPDAYAKQLPVLREKFATDHALRRTRDALMSPHPRRASTQEKTEECTGDYVFESSRCTSSFQVFLSQDCRFLQDADSTHDSMDTYHAGWSRLLYETYSPVRLHSAAFSTQCWDGSNVYYCDTCQSCTDCFGCVALKHGRYCILNKQYTKEEYERLVPVIIGTMRRDGHWGEFPLPVSDMHTYNETMAQEYFPLTKDQALTRGYRWSDYEVPLPKAEKIIKASDLPSSIDDIPDDILRWAIECDTTKKLFKVIKQELDFYRQMSLPVPRLHPDERHRRRMALRNPRKLWSRQCAKCSKPIETTYAPDRLETVFCEECYLKEVY